MRLERLSPRRNPVADYLRVLRRDVTKTDEDRRYLTTQAAGLLREFEGATVSELHRLRAALELLEVGRDRAQSWEVRGPANDRAARLLAGLGVPRRHKGRRPSRPRNGRGIADIFAPPTHETNDTDGG